MFVFLNYNILNYHFHTGVVEQFLTQTIHTMICGYADSILVYLLELYN